MNIKSEITSTLMDMIMHHEKRITVQNLCSRLNISRKTFYQYYHSIEDLLFSIIEEDVFLVIDQLSAMDNLKVEDSILVLNSMYSQIYKNRSFYTCLYASEFKEILLTTLYRKIKELNEMLFTGRYKNDIEREYHVHLAALSGVNIIEKWMKDGFTVSSREISSIFFKYIVRAWVELLEEYK